MDLCEFQGRIYGKYKTHLFVLESDWDTLRPIQRVGWNGTEFEIVDADYKNDIFSPHYGFGSAEMKKVCDTLLKTTELDGRVQITDPIAFWKWCGHSEHTVWWRDRAVLFSSPCVSHTPDAWKRYLQYLRLPPKTLKRSRVMRRVTKRLLPK